MLVLFAISVVEGGNTESAFGIPACIFAKSLTFQVVLVVKNPPANAGDIKSRGFDPWVGKISGAGNGNPLQYSCLENSMDRGAWWATVHGATKSRIQLRD